MDSNLSRPVWLRAFNRAARALRMDARGPMAVDADAIERRAMRLAGTDDFGGDDYREPLERLVAEANARPDITPFGRVVLRANLTRRLVNRLGIEATIASAPGIVDQPVARPVVIAGLPRTGTTLLHRLFAQDPNNRVPRQWEIDRPVPPPRRDTYESDPRIARTRRELALIDRAAPTFRAIHELGAELPEECIGLMANDLRSIWFLVGLTLPRYREWLYDQDLRPVYARHKRQLQVLQWRFRARCWVLKAPYHLWGLDALLATYPDARVIQTHRDPLQVAPSIASLFFTMRSAFEDDVSAADVGREMVDDVRRFLRRSMAVRARVAGQAGSARFVDVHYPDLVADPIGTVRGLYEAFDLAWSDEVDARMRAYLAANRQHKHGRHRYSLDQFGIDPDVARRAVADYCERFGVDIGGAGEASAARAGDAAPAVTG